MAFKKFLLKNAIRLLKVVTPAAQPSMSTGLKPSPFQNKAYGDMKDVIKELSDDPNAHPITAPIDVSHMLAAKSKPVAELSVGEKIDLARFMTVSKDPDVEKLFSLWESASKAGNVEATYSYADCIRAGRGTTRDPVTAFQLMQQLAKEKNLGEAHLALGLMYSKGEGCEIDHEKAFQAFRSAGHEGVLAAIYNMGNCYAEGKGVKQSDSNALLYYEGAIEAGDPAAMFTVGTWIMHEKGGMKKDPARALQLQLQAANMGHPLATFNVGAHYLAGDGVANGEPDILKAVEWFTRAADMGVYQAAINLGNMYVEGLSPLAQDLYKAEEIFMRYSHLHPAVENCVAMIKEEIKVHAANARNS